MDNKHEHIASQGYSKDKLSSKRDDLSQPQKFDWYRVGKWGAIAILVFIVVGFLLLSSSWKVLYDAQQTKTLAVSGPYQYMLHPQYAAFTAIMFGFLLQWPTIPTLIMFPILVYTYVRLSLREEAEMEQVFGEAFRSYARSTPRFIPRPFRDKKIIIEKQCGSKTAI